MVVAIDGPAGVGKSTIARQVAAAAGFLYINSGSFYRAITLAVLRSGRSPADLDGVLGVARSCSLELGADGLILDGSPVEGLLHTDEVDRWVAPHSSIPELREIVNSRLRRIAQGRDVVVEGRDIGTVVFPGAACKVFLDADVETRASRRHAQGTSGLSREALQQAIAERDRVDRSKPTGRLAAAPDAILIDTSHLTISEVCARVRGAILERKNNPGDNRRP
jgi:cytidylate kinase